MKRTIAFVLVANLLALTIAPAASALHEHTRECDHRPGDPVGTLGCAAYDAARNAPHILDDIPTTASHTCQQPADTDCCRSFGGCCDVYVKGACIVFW